MEVEELMKRYFPEVSSVQIEMLLAYQKLLSIKNKEVNLVSRKDTDQLFLHHFVHSLSISKVISFKPGTKVLDIGTGGGFPGVPLAILNPESKFTLVDSIRKKINAVAEMTNDCKMQNISCLHERAEKVRGRYDFVVSRAVAPLSVIYDWVHKKISPDSFNSLKNGLILLKGGDLSAELASINKKARLYPVTDFVSEPYFEKKYVVYVKM